MSQDTRGEILIATQNAGKVVELAELLAELPLRLRSLAEFPPVPAPEETGSTFADNAELKARFYATHTGLLTLADDSGLEADALGGAPGVHSARYAGENATDEERIARLLAEMRTSRVSSRAARFVCVIALFDPREVSCELFKGTCAGRIGHEPRGTNGFGYDPVFVPDGFDRTFAELPREIKQRISHRAQALGAARTYLAKAFSQHP